MEDSTLLFRHLPSSLSTEELKDFFHFVGADQVRMMGQSGPMKNTAFAVFKNKEKAKEVLSQLHQTDFLGSTLKVEFARKPQNKSVPSNIDKEGTSLLENKDDEEATSSDKVENNLRLASEVKFDSVFSSWGINYPRRPELRYLYPPPTPSILTNIMHALAAVPKFYVQVLHLMNKMDLPAPFGMVTPKPPINPDVHVSSVPDDISQKEMEISSSSESELSSSEEERMRKDDKYKHASSKRTYDELKRNERKMLKRPKLSDLHDFEQQIPTNNNPSIPLSDVFEKSKKSAPIKKIEMKISGTVKPSLVKHVSPHFIDETALLYDPSEPTMPTMALPQSSLLPTSHTKETNPSDVHHHSSIPADSNQYTHHRSSNISEPAQELQGLENERNESVAVGFGVMEPQPKQAESDQEEEEVEEKTWSKGKFISFSELKKSRLSSKEMRDMNIFRKYSSGDPSCRLYIKNLSKQVSEEDLHWVFGRYVNWDSQSEVDIFDIQLMKEGRMKGQSFITLPNEEAAVCAVKETNGFVFRDKPMVVQFARSAKAEKDKASKI